MRKDNVHPNALGHLLMAYYLCREAGLLDGRIAEVAVDAAAGKVKTANHAAVRNVKTDAEGISFEYAPERLPFIPDKQHEGIDALVPFTADFNTEFLQVTGLADGNYQLSANGKKIGVFTSDALAKGIDLAVLDTPSRRQAIKDMGGVGVALDAGIQYVTGPYDNVHFGITLKNIGPTMKFSGDGISLRVFMDNNSNQQFTMVQRVDDFELPTQLSIAAGYDWVLGETSRLTVAGNFCSNSFTNDQFTLGMEYGFKDLFMVRAGYTYENGIWAKGGALDNDECMNINRGLSAGVSVQVPLSKKEDGMKLAVDYSYRDTYVFNGTHSVGARIIF